MRNSQEPAMFGGKPVRDTFLVFGEPDIQEPEIQEVVAVLRSRWIGSGPRSQRFERLFAEYIGCKHAISLNSCTAGLELALDILEIGPGDEVITSPLTFAATANVIVHRGAVPVFVDVEATTGNIDPAGLEAAITPRTKAILPVHLYGFPCRMDAIMALARQYGLYVIEDAAHATEAWYRGRKIGTIADITVFSFYATKNMTTAEGGMLVTDNDEWAQAARIKHLHGLSKDAWKRYSAEGFQPYDVTYPGYKFNMTDMQAALGIHQLARLESNLEIRQNYWDLYSRAFSNLDGIQLLPASVSIEQANDARHARHLYTVLYDIDRLGMSRWEFIDALKAENIGTGIHFVALHLTSFYRDHLPYHRGDFPRAEFISDRTISLPLGPAMSEQDVEDVIAAVKKILAFALRPGVNK